MSKNCLSMVNAHKELPFLLLPTQNTENQSPIYVKWQYKGKWQCRNDSRQVVGVHSIQLREQNTNPGMLYCFNIISEFTRWHNIFPTCFIKSIEEEGEVRPVACSLLSIMRFSKLRCSSDKS